MRVFWILMDIILKSINPSPPNGRKPVFRNLQEPFTGFYFLCNSGVKASLVCCGVVWCATSPLRCCVHTAWQAFLGGRGGRGGLAQQGDVHGSCTENCFSVVYYWTAAMYCASSVWKIDIFSQNGSYFTQFVQGNFFRWYPPKKFQVQKS